MLWPTCASPQLAIQTRINSPYLELLCHALHTSSTVDAVSCALSLFDWATPAPATRLASCDQHGQSIQTAHIPLLGILGISDSASSPPSFDSPRSSPIDFACDASYWHRLQEKLPQPIPLSSFIEQTFRTALWICSQHQQNRIVFTGTHNLSCALTRISQSWDPLNRK